MKLGISNRRSSGRKQFHSWATSAKVKGRDLSWTSQVDDLRKITRSFRGQKLSQCVKCFIIAKDGIESLLETDKEAGPSRPFHRFGNASAKGNG